MCACTEPVRTGIGAVCVEYGRPKWPIPTSNHTESLVQKNALFFYFCHPMLVRPTIKRLFCLRVENGLIIIETRNRKGTDRTNKTEQVGSQPPRQNYFSSELKRTERVPTKPKIK